MTQIVYDGEYVYADRKVYRYGTPAGESRKIKVIHRNGVKLIYAFSGSFLECAIGEEVVESFFDPEVCEKARKRLSQESLEDFNHNTTEIRDDRTTSDMHRVFLVNFAGDKCEMERGCFFALGAMCDVLQNSYRVATEFCLIKPNIENLIRFVTSNTTQDQTGYVIDKIRIGDF